MLNGIKLFALVFGIIIAGAVAVLGYLLTSIDPNSYKPQIEKAATENHIQLDIRGDLELSVFPTLALKIGETRFSSDVYQLPPSSFESAALSLDLFALLRKQVAINALEIRQADIHLTRLEQAGAVAATSPGQDGKVESGTGDFAVAIDRIDIVNSSFTLLNEDGETRIDNLNLTSKGINTGGEWFPLETTFSYAVEDEANLISLKLTTEARFDQRGQTLALKGAQTTIGGILPKELMIALNAEVDLANQSATISNLSGNVGNIVIEGNAAISDIDSDPEARGTLTLSGSDLSKTITELTGTELVTTNPDALKLLVVSTGYVASTDKIHLNNLKLKLDNTDFKGDLLLSLTTPRNLIFNLAGTTINIDHYLPPVVTDAEEPANDMLLAPLIAPLAVLDGGRGIIKLSMDEVVANGINLNAPRMTLTADGKRLTVSDLQTGVFNGTVTANVAVDASGNEPRVSFSKKLNAINIHQAMSQFTDNADLTGTLNMSIQGTTRGQSQQELMANLTAIGKLSIEEPHLASVNIEQNYCELAAMVEQPPARQEPWPKGTNLNNLTSDFRFNGPVLELLNYNTGVGNLKLRGNGKIYLDKESFNIKAITRLEGDKTSNTGCTVKSRRVRDKDLPLICKDSFANAGATSCKPDPDLLKSLLKDELIDKLLDDGGDGEEDPVKGLLKGLFN